MGFLACVLTLEDMIDKIDGHNPRFEPDREMLADKLDIRILQEPVEEILLRNLRLLYRPCPPCFDTLTSYF